MTTEYELSSSCTASTGAGRTALTGYLRFKFALIIFSAVLLGLGYLLCRVQPLYIQIGELIMAVSSLIVSIPIFIYALKGFFSPQTCFVTEQLVSIAVLASMVKGDFISATLIPVFMAVGHFFEEKSIMGVEQAISGLKLLYSRRARVVRDGGEIEVSPDQLSVGETVICYPGDTIACDGLVLFGESWVNQAPITGESHPVSINKGSRVYAGTVNLSGKIEIKMTEASDDSVIKRVTQMLSEAEKSKAPIVKIVENYTGMYLPIVLLIAGITLFFTRSIIRAVTILVVSCPCALVLASPTAMIAALVVASRLGIMIKNASFLEVLSEVRTLILDKTGTVTMGRMSLDHCLPEGITEKELITVAATCASGSVHPVSRAIRSYVSEKGIDFIAPDSIDEVPGNGVHAKCSGKELFMGKPEWVGEKIGVSLSGQDKTCVCLAKDDQFLGYILFSDLPRPEVREAVEQCCKSGVERVILVTGDRKEIADELGRFIGADEVMSECMPSDKLEIVKKEKRNGVKVLTVGDGINDALALAASDAGVALGAMGSDIAIQSADIALLSDNTERIPQMMQLSNRTRRTIHFNIVIGTGFSLFMMGLAASGAITPLFGALFHNIGSIFVVLNSARLLSYKPKNMTEIKESSSINTHVTENGQIE